VNDADLPAEEDLLLIEALGAVDGPDPAVRDRHLIELRATAAPGHDAAQATVRPLWARPARRASIAAGVVGIAAALLAVVVLEARPTPQNRAEASPLERLATKAGDPAPLDPERPVLHITYRLATDDDGGDVPHGPNRPPERVEAWRRADGSGLEGNTLLRPGGRRQVIPASDPEGSMYAWNEAHRSCTLRRAGDAGVLTTLQGRRFDAELLASLPTDPRQLRVELERLLRTKVPHLDASEEPASTPSKETRARARSCEATTGETRYSAAEVERYVDGAVLNLLGPWSTPKLRSAAFDLLAERDDVTVGKGTDPLGRDAVTIVDDVQGVRITTYVDPTTSEYLASVGRNADGTRVTETVVEAREWVADVPAA
jgi:hypothetical protein